jgi:hypothetical protein
MAKRGRPPGQTAETLARLDWYEDAIFRLCCSRQTVERQAMKKYGIKARQSREYMRAVRERWAANRSVNAEDIRQELDGTLRHGIFLAIERGELRALAALCGRLAELHGVEAPQRIEVTQPEPVSTDPVEACRDLAEAAVASEDFPAFDEMYMQLRAEKLAALAEKGEPTP